jgi:hypothetical protein
MFITAQHLSLDRVVQVLALSLQHASLGFFHTFGMLLHANALLRPESRLTLFLGRIYGWTPSLGWLQEAQFNKLACGGTSLHV